MVPEAGVTVLVRAREPAMKRLPLAAPVPACGRRAFLEGAVAGVAGLIVVGCGAAGAGASFGDVTAGNAASLNVGDLKVVPGVAACVGRDAKGLYAMSVLCTHQACDMSTQGSVSPSGLACDCHGSRFDVNGAVLRGPASAPLEHFAVSIDAAGTLTVHGGTVVDATTRVTA